MKHEVRCHAQAETVKNCDSRSTDKCSNTNRERREKGAERRDKDKENRESERERVSE